MEDEETSKYIYGFIESHGGIEKATQELERTESEETTEGRHCIDVNTTLKHVKTKS